MDLSIGSEERPLFRANAEGVTVFATGSSSAWDEKQDCWFDTRWRYQPVGIPWHKVVDAAAAPAERRQPGRDAADGEADHRSADALVIRTEVEPSVNLGDFYFGSQGYEKSDLIGLSREEWNEDDLTSRIAIPRRDLPIDLEKAVPIVASLWQQQRDSAERDQCEYQIPAPRRRKANAITRIFLRWLKKRIGD